MSINKLRSIAQRGSIFGVVVAVLAAVVLPSTAVFADALNPLTERSLLLTSSAPGFRNSDGSGNTAENPNTAGTGEYYAPPGSGPNGQKTGETFTFRVSTDSRDEAQGGTGKTIHAFSLQYCVEAAGLCRAPGNNPVGESNADVMAGPANTADFEAVYPNPVLGTDFSVTINNQVSTGWVLATDNLEDGAHSEPLTGKDNFITLVNAAGVKPPFNAQVVIKFFASDTQYITNPGDSSFFVRINSYKSPTNFVSVTPSATNTDIVDGGVTVANVMTDSIHITTKVLETMSFSVGTQNRDTTALVNPATHGTCDNILQPNGNRLQLGNPNAEYSLETDTAYDVYSYWRLSSNSSGGATVYYSGNTLQNTVGDRIAPIGPAASLSTPGTEQFGLAFVPASNPDQAAANPTADTGDIMDQAFLDKITAEPTRFALPTITADNLTKTPAYANGTGSINASPAATFAFEAESNTSPRVIATNSQNVISCATAKMRYVANIGADTPAGVYTTKINYLAAPQY